MSSPLWLAEITVYDPAIVGTRVLRYSNVGFVTRPSDTPADMHYADRIVKPASVTRNIFSEGKTGGQSKVSEGELVLNNADGSLDALLTYAFDGRELVMRRGRVGNVYSALTTRSLTMTQVEVSGDEIRIGVRDWGADLSDAAFQTTKYAGTNTPPAGLEGGADLKGKPKPVLLGQVFNIMPPCVNQAKLIYQISDGAIASVDGVFDRGVSLAASIAAWSAQTSSFGASDIRAVTHNGTIYVAVGVSGKIATSSDGTTWAQIATTPFGTDIIYAVVWDSTHSLFVAAGAQGKLFTSPDGSTWTSRTSQFGTSDIMGLACSSAGKLVAVGALGKISTSTNATIWTAQTALSGTPTAGGVAVGTSGRFVLVEPSKARYSDDSGVTWTDWNNVAGTVLPSAVSYGNGLFIITGVTATAVIMTSADGVTFTLRYSDSSSHTPRTAGIWANGLYVVGGDSNALFTSPNGLTWTAQNAAFGAAHIYAIATNGSSQFVAVGSAGTLTASTGAATYGSLADLQDDSLQPAAGTYKAYLTGGYIRLGLKPEGQLTCHATQGANAAARSIAQLWKAVLDRKGYVSGTDYSAGDITTLDGTDAFVEGFWSGTDEVKYSDVLDRIAGGLAWWGPDNAGVMRLKKFIAATGTPAFAITQHQMTRGSFRRLPMNGDVGKGIPVYKQTIQYARNYTVQSDNDLAAGATATQRDFVSREWRAESYTDATVLTTHLLSQEIVDESLLVSSANAATEAQRREVLRASQRARYEFRAKHNEFSAEPDLANVATVTHSRFGLSAGQDFVVIMIEDVDDDELLIQVWG